MSEVVAPIEAPPVVEAPAKESVSPAFEILAKKESQLVRQQMEMKKEREEVEKMREAMSKDREEYQRYQERKKLAKLNPNLALEDYGLSYEELTQFQLNGGVPQGEVIAKSVKEQLEQFRKDHEATLAKDRDAQKKQAEEQYQAQVEEFKVNMTDFIVEKADEFELINKYKTYDLVYTTITEHFENTKKEGKPRVLSTKEAADLVEKHLEDLVDQGLKSKKFSNRTKPTDPQTPQETREQVAKTLTNSMNSSSVPTSLSPKTEDERIKRALAALGG